MDLYLEELEKAIRSGDVTVASESAKILANAKANIKLSIDEGNLPERKIRVKVIIEDRYISDVSIKLDLLPSMKFAELKQLVFEKFGFPTAVQNWIAGKRLAKDTDSLRSCGIRQDDDTMYLYLVSAQSVGLHRQRTLNPNVVYSDSGEVSSVPPIASPSVIVLTVGWQCPRCTLINEPTRPGCIACAESRPDSYIIPSNYELSDNERIRIEQETRFEEEANHERELNFQQLIATEESNLIKNIDYFECPVCFDRIDPGHGVMLRGCLHVFCRVCLENQVRHAESAIVSCPFIDGLNQCFSVLQEREIKALVSDELYLKHLALSLTEAESQAPNSFHCQTPNCVGWCIYEDDVNIFECDLCKQKNCLTCKAIHDGISCKQYQDEVKNKAKKDVAARRTQQKIDAMLRKGDAMMCPTCDIIVMKKDGCDWIRCTMCKTEICWVTKGARWGPGGTGDISGGCRCGVNDKPCHPNCQNCH